MSRLAPVTTGQPTQGIGAAPTKRQHASPLEAQRAEAEASGSLLMEDLEAIATPPAVNPRSAHSAAAATVTAAWLSLEAKELEVRKYFRSLEVPSGLEMLARMRKQCDLAAEVLQQRMDEGNTERCTGCGKTLEEARKTQWIMSGAEVDPETGIPMPYRFCGVLCVRERNREKMLPKELRDQKRFDGADMGEVR
jgi:hypothetical protein